MRYLTKRARMLGIVLVGMIGLTVGMSGCGRTVFVQPTLPPPSDSPTPLSTALPPVSTQVPLGSTGRPYHIAVLAYSAYTGATATSTPTATPTNTSTPTPSDTPTSVSTERGTESSTERSTKSSAGTAIATANATMAATSVGTAAATAKVENLTLAGYLSTRVGLAFQVDMLPSAADVLKELCNGPPTFAWLDGPGLLAALAQGCGTPALKFERGANFRTGVQTDLVIRTGGKGDPTALSGLKGKDFCRLNGQDLTSWILPALMLRAGGLDPAQDLHGFKKFDSTDALLQAVANGTCAATGIPAGTLGNFSPTLAAGQSLKVLQTSPELPYGGLVISKAIPSAVANQVIRLFSQQPPQLSSLIGTDTIAPTTADDYVDFQRLAQAAHLDLSATGR
ncbi:MAG: phosphate/phosphite/phosphonate ABC transporter substrate-binding protein [Aggregatilineales bacterium]